MNTKLITCPICKKKVIKGDKETIFLCPTCGVYYETITEKIELQEDGGTIETKILIKQQSAVQ